MNRKAQLPIIIAIIGAIFLGAIITLAQDAPEQLDETITYSQTSETTCNEGICTTTYYSYQKYWLNEEASWEQIDESFDTESCDEGYDYCVDRNLYQVHANIADHTLKIIQESREITVQPSALYYRNGEEEELITAFNEASEAVIEDNKLTFINAFGEGINLQFTYLPTMLKEEIILTDQAQLLPPAMSGEITLDADFIIDLGQELTPFIDGEPSLAQETIGGIDLDIGEETIFTIPQGVAYDAQGAGVLLTQIIYTEGNQTYATLKTPYQWLVETPLTYPIILDPSIALGHGDVHWNGELWNTTSLGSCSGTYCFARIDNPTTLNVGDASGDKRAGIEWNISNIPDNADPTSIELSLHSLTAPSNFELKIYHMEQGSNDYANAIQDCEGNCHFYKDLHNGTLYNNSSITAVQEYILSLDATEGFTEAKYTDLFGIGLSVDDITTRARFASDSYSNASQRPTLNVTYVLWANETEGDEAIEQGILAIIPSATYTQEQQVNTRTTIDTQELGSFDYYVKYNDKRWAINHITENEQYTNMNNVSTKFYVLELANLTAIELQLQVEVFINSTL